MELLVSVQDVRKRLNWAPDRDPDAKIIAQEATSAWETQTQRLWGCRRNYEETFEDQPREEKMITLPLYPLTSLDVIAWDELATEPTNWADVSNTTNVKVLNVDYTAKMKEGIVRLQVLFNNWKFRMTGGYTAATLLTEHQQGHTIKEALLLQCVYTQARNEHERIASVSVVVGDATATLRGNKYHPQFEALAKTFRKWF